VLLAEISQDPQQLKAQSKAAETPDQIKAAKAASKKRQSRHPADPSINTLLTQDL
jgi:hypothetical protein